VKRHRNAVSKVMKRCTSGEASPESHRDGYLHV